MTIVDTLSRFKPGETYYIHNYGGRTGEDLFICHHLRIMQYYVILKEINKDEEIWFYNHHFKNFEVKHITRKNDPEYFL